mmetsp:Transcript_10923/g.16367  ORF Transcript_10923/g.16367 Transcript_10923/m.16367 type:complete len:811 (+) Transcript_10923:146-2578(+)|eukprot:CAMPEP_0196813198 /NCGR_PEP_ID=MMETSP1362-20130617/34575_1 /TAXON_ID=163516 /ORGANISM="Leptocylindrus danicus, Strain CCMP1856" /LENGTH=810 /DNA_ID=CAMNT_0042189277 /DNA_START=114 /DNA_END=2546 /DNA_ORIENTATION=-
MNSPPSIAINSNTLEALALFAASIGLHLLLLRPASAFGSFSTSSSKKQTITDPYIYLEEVESEESLAFARNENEKCLAALGSPEESETYGKLLQVLENDDRIPYAGKMGKSFGSDDDEELVYNFWKDKNNTKGIWRRTTLRSYKSDQKPDWETIIDLDELGKKDNISWVYKGTTPLARSRDDPLKNENGRTVTRSLISLSVGGADATVLRELCLVNKTFVCDATADDGDELGNWEFTLPEAKTRASYKSRDVLYVGSDFGPGSLTDSGYPRVVKEWVRGTSIEDAPIIFEGEKTDVSVSAYINDQRSRGGPIYEMHHRSLTFYTSRQWARKLEPEHLLPAADPKRIGAPEPADFVEMDVQEDAFVSFFSNLITIKLRSDWKVGGRMYKTGSLLVVPFNDFVSQGKDRCTFQVLFEPSESSALDDYCVTKNFLLLSIIEDVKSKLTFLKFDVENGSFTEVGGDSEAKIRSTSAWAVDSTESDEFWCSISGYTQPTSLYIADANRLDESSSLVSHHGDSSQASFYLENLIKSLPPQYAGDGFDVQQRLATSKDGTKIPYFLVVKNGIKMDGNTPTLLYGYGGFEISMTPHYTGTQGVAWLERGGAYVEANIRGGGEYGPGWHQAALKANRNKAFEDFIAVAEDLCESGLCKPQTLGTRGGSNGGLLMGMMLVLRPDLFGAIHCAVPLLDMQRFHTLLAGASWMAEYGNPDTDDWDKFLCNYSPYHLINQNQEYPPILFTTSTRDDRVHPAHARKMVKKLHDVGNGRWPVYYYENIEGGHGGAADSKQSAFMLSLAYDFLWNTLSKGVSGSSD